MPLHSQKTRYFSDTCYKKCTDGSDLTLTKLGRKLETNTTVKHAIKRVDRLLGNRQLHREKT